MLQSLVLLLFSLLSNSVIQPALKSITSLILPYQLKRKRKHSTKLTCNHNFSNKIIKICLLLIVINFYSISIYQVLAKVRDNSRIKSQEEITRLHNLNEISTINEIRLTEMKNDNMNEIKKCKYYSIFYLRINEAISQILIIQFII